MGPSGFFLTVEGKHEKLRAAKVRTGFIFAKKCFGQGQPKQAVCPAGSRAV